MIGKLLCKLDLHKWKETNRNMFRGKMVVRMECERCNGLEIREL